MLRAERYKEPKEVLQQLCMIIGLTNGLPVDRYTPFALDRYAVIIICRFFRLIVVVIIIVVLITIFNIIAIILLVVIGALVIARTAKGTF